MKTTTPDTLAEINQVWFGLLPERFTFQTVVC